MAPPSAPDPTAALKALHRRSTSGSASPRPDSSSKASKKTSPPAPNVHYTLLIKLPFARGDFEDPPQVDWDSAKDKKLWKIISKNSKSAEIDWAQHAQEFGVTQPFLLQQAAWLYERHFQNVKAQMTRLRTSNAPTPTPSTTTASQQPQLGGYAMKRLGSGGGGGSRAPSSLSIRSRDSPIPRTDGGASGPIGTRPELSRTPSTATVTQSKPFLPPASPRQAVQRSFRSGAASSRRGDIPKAEDQSLQPDPSPPASESSSTSSSDSTDSDAGPIRRSQLLFRRPPPNQAKKKPSLSNVDDIGEDSADDSPTFLPFASKAGTALPPSTTTPSAREDPSATLRDTTPPRTRGTVVAAVHSTSTPKGKARQQQQPSSSSAAAAATKLESSASSASSAAAPPTAPPHRRVDALSPRHRAELARLGSPRRQKDGSDGTPSMGSSFSDLDDTSITQSALEEALASNLRHGGASRLSTISHAFGSRLYGRGQQQGQ